MPSNRKRFFQEIVKHGFEEVKDCDTPKGEGTFGQIFFMFDKNNNKQVAIKRFKVDKDTGGFDDNLPEAFLREVCAYRNIGINSHVLEVFDIYSNPLCIAMERASCSLSYFLKSKVITGSEKLMLKQQLMKGLVWCHQSSIMHRDLKPQNMVMKDSTLKICDFGNARTFFRNSDRSYTLDGTTLWYKPIEMLLGNDKYNEKVDIWSAGCIFYEIDESRPLFMPECQAELLFLIYKFMGNPTEETYPGVESLQYFNRDMLINSTASTEGKCKIMLRMLTYDVKKRADAAEVLDMLENSHNQLEEK